MQATSMRQSLIHGSREMCPGPIISSTPVDACVPMDQATTALQTPCFWQHLPVHVTCPASHKVNTVPVGFPMHARR